MTEVISVKFKNRGKTYFFDPCGIQVPDGTQVVVETAKGLELADCVQGNHEVDDRRIVPPLRPVVRAATQDDLRIAELCKAREKEAFAICEEKISKRGLDMKLVDVECNFEGNKILFFFTSDGRVDFRELVKDLAGVFRTRIELRQIGVRDEAKMIGGIGICGRPFCCSQFLNDFEPVSTKMAKIQSLSLNPAKISGSCGRLMCCLRYEQAAYEDLVKTVPKNGAFVETPDGYGNICQINLLRQKVKVKLDSDESFKSYDAGEVAAVPGGRPKPGEQPPHVLELKAKTQPEPEPEAEREDWNAPAMFGEQPVESPDSGRPAEARWQTPSRPEEPRDGGRPNQRRRRPRRKKAPGDRPQEQERPNQGPAKAPGGQKTSDSEKKPGGHGRPRRRRPPSSGGQPPKQGGHGDGRPSGPKSE